MKNNLKILKLFLKIETKLMFVNYIFIDNLKMCLITFTKK